MLAAIMVTIDVTFRKAFALTMIGSDEYSGYVFAASTTWAYSYCLPHLLPPIVLLCAVVGSIYGGVATPTDSTSIGVVMALVIAACLKTLSFGTLRDAFEGTMRTTAMIIIIVFAAIFFILFSGSWLSRRRCLISSLRLD